MLGARYGTIGARISRTGVWTVDNVHRAVKLKLDGREEVRQAHQYTDMHRCVRKACSAFGPEF